MIHQALLAGGLALFTAQALKSLTHMAKVRRWDLRVSVGSGGMPSSHTALVVATTTTIGLVAGFETPLFDVAAVFSAIVMYDATGVRQAAGKQAAIVNKILEELSTTHSLREERLKELLGHTRLEVVGGAIYGVLVAVLLHYGW